MIAKIYITAALLFLTLSSTGATDSEKFDELYAKYMECEKNNDYLGSVKYLEESLSYIHPDSIYCFSDTYNGLSYAYWDMGLYDKAVNYGKLALECDFQIGDSARISQSFNLLAILFAHQRLFDKGEQYMQKAIMYVPQNNSQMKAARYAVLGEILATTGKYEEAIKHIRESYFLDSINNRTDRIPVRLSQLGAAYMHHKEYSKAEITLAQATKGLRQTGNIYSLCINLLAQTKNYIALGRKTDAEKTASECLALSSQINKRKTKLEAMRHLASLRKSPELYEQTLALNDSLYNEQIREQIADFEVRYATAEKEKEKAQLQVIVNRQRYALVVLAIVFASLLIGVVLIYIVRRMRHDIEHTETMARELFVNKTPNNSSGKSSADEDKVLPNNDMTKQTSTISSDKQIEPAAEETDRNIQLSPREMDIVKACCQGKLSKEIADEFGISKKTVDNHKSAIYQKIGICNNTELILFAIKHGIVKF